MKASRKEAAKTVRIIYMADVRIDGKRIRKAFETEEAARKWEAQQKKKVLRGRIKELTAQAEKREA